MCGRYTFRSRGSGKLYGVPASELPFLVPRYNIAPSQGVPVIVERGRERRLAMFQWGLIPSWSKEPNRLLKKARGALANPLCGSLCELCASVVSVFRRNFTTETQRTTEIAQRKTLIQVSPRLLQQPAKGFINARAETLSDKPSFSESFERRRCLIPADGFYEWMRNGRSKQPYFFQMKDEAPFAFAGIWDKWQGSGLSITSCAIITTTANELLATIHDRMPVILDADVQERWLRSDARIAELKNMLVPFPGSRMKSFPVSSRANSAEADDAQLVEEVEIRQEPTTGLLF